MMNAKKLYKFLASVLFCYAVVACGLYLLQRKILYQPNQETPERQTYGVSNMQLVQLKTEDRLVLTSWYQPPAKGQPTIVYFHGNAGHIGHRAFAISPYLAWGYGALLFEYRGYGGNAGNPSEYHFYQDAQLAMQFLHDQGIESRCLVLYGESLGTAVAVEIATHFSVGAVILQSPFNRLADVAFYHYPYLPTGLMLKDSYDSQAKIASIDAPLLIIHGDNDKVVPMRYGQQLYQAAKQPKQFIQMKKNTHNNFDDSVLADLVKFFLQQQQVC